MQVRKKNENVKKGPRSSEHSVPGLSHIPPRVQLLLQPPASSKQEEHWVLVYLVTKGLQETSLSKTPRATPLSTPLLQRLHVTDPLLLTSQQPLQAHLLSQRKNQEIWQKSLQKSIHLPMSSPNDPGISLKVKMEKGQSPALSQEGNGNNKDSGNTSLLTLCQHRANC